MNIIKKIKRILFGLPHNKETDVEAMPSVQLYLIDFVLDFLKTSLVGQDILIFHDNIREELNSRSDGDVYKIRAFENRNKVYTNSKLDPSELSKEIEHLERQYDDLNTEARERNLIYDLEALADLTHTQSQIRHKINGIKEELSEKLTQLVLQPHLCIRVNAGRLEVLVREIDGTYIVAGDSVILSTGIIVPKVSPLSKAIFELEKLINKPDVKEKELQDFFEEYPMFMCEDEYEELISQPVIQCDRSSGWEVDFVLKPADPIKFAKLCELKLPKERQFKKPYSGHLSFTAKLKNSIDQLKDYGEQFDQLNVREKFYENYKIDVFKPDLQLIYGRRPKPSLINDYKLMQRREGIEIVDWDTLVAQLKSKFMR